MAWRKDLSPCRVMYSKKLARVLARVQNSHPDAKDPTVSIKFYLTFGSSLFRRRQCIALIQTGLQSTAHRGYSIDRGQ